jgi:hypothetical protein
VGGHGIEIAVGGRPVVAGIEQAGAVGDAPPVRAPLEPVEIAAMDQHVLGKARPLEEAAGVRVGGHAMQGGEIGLDVRSRFAVGCDQALAQLVVGGRTGIQQRAGRGDEGLPAAVDGPEAIGGVGMETGVQPVPGAPVERVAVKRGHARHCRAEILTRGSHARDPQCRARPAP